MISFKKEDLKKIIDLSLNIRGKERLVLFYMSIYIQIALLGPPQSHELREASFGSI